MVQNRYKYFRWTKRTAGISTVYVFIIPAIIGYLGYQNDVSDPLWHRSWKRMALGGGCR